MLTSVDGTRDGQNDGAAGGLVSGHPPNCASPTSAGAVSSKSWECSSFSLLKHKNLITVDGRNPAPVDS